MSKILVSQNVTISNPKLKAIADDIANQLKLAADKVVLNHFAPQEFPIKNEQRKKTFETIMNRAFKSLSEDKKKAAHDRVKARFALPINDRRKHFGIFSEIDLRKSSSVEESAKSLNFPDRKITADELGQEKNKLFNSVIPQKKYKFNLEVKNRLADIVVPTEQDKINKLLKDKHQAMGGDAGILGKCTGWVYAAGGHVICERGAIYINNGTAFEIHGAIWGKYKELNSEVGILGRPTTDELTTPDGKGRYNHFDNGSIYWHPDFGAYEIHGAILEKWKALGWEQSFLGYPITDESATPDGIGRYNHFQNGSIYWTAKTGAWEVHGSIRDLWESLGWEKSELGYPVTDELPLPNNGRYNRFQGGEIHWYPRSGAVKAAFSPFSMLTLRCVRLHCIDETNPEWEGGDEMRMVGTVVEINSDVLQPIGYNFGKIDLEDNWDDNEWNCWTSPRYLLSIPLNNNKWPKAFAASCVLVEDDDWGGYTDVINELYAKLIAKAKEEVKKELVKTGEAAGEAEGGPIGGAIGALIGYIAAQVANYIIDAIAKEIQSLWNNEFFPPVSVSIELPDSKALFGNGTLDSEDFQWTVWGHGGKYEFWLDWMLS